MASLGGGTPVAAWQRKLGALAAGGVAPGGLSAFLEESYGSPGAVATAAQRYRRITERYRARFGDTEVWVARAPGRINLIGEHTDYNGLPVLPMAIDRDIAAVFAPRADATVVLADADPAYPERSFQVEESIPSYPTGDWGNYAKAAVEGLVTHLGALPRPGGAALRGFQAVVHGEIPSAAGMSSSSALVVLCALMFLAANGLELAKLELADLLARAERYVGTQGGGMDQAVCLMGQRGKALKIDFFPLRVETAPLPAGYTFVVSNSLVRAAKTADALDKYNRRPIECRLATAVVKADFSRRYGREVPLELLGDLRPDRLGVPEEEIRSVADGAFHQESYGLEEIASRLGQASEVVAQTYCRRRDGSVFPQPADGFKLWHRYRHVVEEGRRVEACLRALRSGDTRAVGALMDQSHTSCRDLYEISCPELDLLVGISRRAGALGARLTGAGFGGCSISLVREQRVESFRASVVEEYYRSAGRCREEDMDSAVFPCQAVAGAAVMVTRP